MKMKLVVIISLTQLLEKYVLMTLPFSWEVGEHRFEADLKNKAALFIPECFVDTRSIAEKCCHVIKF